MWRIEKRGIIKRWHWMIFLSSCGMATGQAWTKKGAEKQLLLAQARLLS